MSAYVVDRETIGYLVDMGLEVARRNIAGSEFIWFHNRSRKILILSNATAVGQMLWDENLASVSYRYPDIKEGGEIPGPIGDDYVFFHASRDWAWRPVQIIKAIDCYEYQACEHPEWEGSSAKAYTESLHRQAARLMVGYDRAEWGSPEPRGNLIPLF